jgi:hypothetical protein
VVPGLLGAFGIVFNEVIKFYEKFSFEKTVLFGNCCFLVKLRNLKQFSIWKCSTDSPYAME